MHDLRKKKAARQSGLGRIEEWVVLDAYFLAATAGAPPSPS